MIENKKGLLRLSCLLFSILLCFSLCGCNTENVPVNIQEPVAQSGSISNDTEIIDSPVVMSENEPNMARSVENEKEIAAPIEGPAKELEDISVKFIDVGQADSCVIVTPNNDVILIDTGEKKDASAIIAGLSDFEFEDIDLMILTHPHADHIGGAQTILNTYKTKEVLMSSFVATTKVFNGVLDTLEEQDIVVTQAILGKTYNIDGVEIEVVGVDSVSTDNNNSSVIVKVTYGTVDLLFTGDLEEAGENVVLNNGFDLSAEVLKVGHHGSETSTSETFLDAINPKLCIISVGEGNKYNHPSDKTIQKLRDRAIQYYRTDEVGNILLEIDGVNIVSILDDSFNTTNARSKNSFLFAPNVAEVQLELEDVVVEDVIENRVSK